MKNERLKVAVYGAGAMGTVLGALLTKSGEAVDLITRNAAHVESMKKTGATIFCRAEGKEIFTPVNALSPEEMRKDYDVIFLMTKQRDNAEIARFLKDKLSENGVVCTTQNGLPEPILCQELGEERVFGGVCSFGANFIGEGKCELTSEFSAMRLVVGGCAENAEAEKNISSVLSGVGEVVGNPRFLSVTDNLSGVRWNKLSVNAAFSALSVLTGLPFGKIAKNGKLKKIALKMMQECFAVADASGVKQEKMQGHDLRKLFGKGGFFKTRISLCLLPFAVKKHKLLVSGMLADVQKGKRCEIDFITGEVCAQGKRAGVETPLCDRVVEMIHGVENGLYEITEKNAAMI